MQYCIKKPTVGEKGPTSGRVQGASAPMPQQFPFGFVPRTHPNALMMSSCSIGACFAWSRVLASSGGRGGGGGGEGGSAHSSRYPFPPGCTTTEQCKATPTCDVIAACPNELLSRGPDVTQRPPSRQQLPSKPALQGGGGGLRPSITGRTVKEQTP